MVVGGCEAQRRVGAAGVEQTCACHSRAGAGCQNTEPKKTEVAVEVVLQY